MTIRKQTHRRRDYRKMAVISLLALLVTLGYLVKLIPGRGIEANTQPAGAAAPATAERATLADLPQQETPVRQAREKEAANDSNTDTGKAELDRALKRAAALVEAKKYDDAIRALNQVRPLAGDSAQAYLLLGLALQGKGEPAAARDFISKAIDLDPGNAQAYFQHATASESLGDLESALGGMRTFLHLVKNRDPYRLQVAQARSAIWEWESTLGRGPWGPTKGIPPGFTADEIKRDGRGVGVKMAIPGSERPDGTMDYEIKSGDRFPKLWKK